MMRLLQTLVVASLSALAAHRFGRGRVTEDVAPAAEKPHLLDKSRLKHCGKLVLLLIPALLLLGFLVALSGIVPIKASSGHLAITAWFLNFSMERSVATHSIGISAPDLDDRRMVVQGAGHFDGGCRPCHGSPGTPRPIVAGEMTPHPPYLPPLLSKWEPDELFYIVKHGVKFTGMPAWPARVRDDEVWAVVAFLEVLAELDQEEYIALARGSDPYAKGGAPIEDLAEPDQPPSIVVESCARCHGADGMGRGGAYPRLAGQRPNYLYASMLAFARGHRYSGMMEPVAAGLSVEQMREVSRYYAGLAPAGLNGAVLDSVEAIRRGEELAREGDPREGIPSCVDCHGPQRTRRNPYYPDLAGQYARYLSNQLKLFKEERRGGTPFAHLMDPTADRLTEQQMHDVALYYESLGAADAPVPSATSDEPGADAFEPQTAAEAGEAQPSDF